MFTAPPTPPTIYGNEEMLPLEGGVMNLTCEAQGGNPLALLSWFKGVEKVI